MFLLCKMYKAQNNNIYIIRKKTKRLTYKAQRNIIEENRKEQKERCIMMIQLLK